MKRRFLRSAFLLAAPLALAAATGFSPRPEPPSDQAVYDNEIRPSLRKYCGACHGATASGGINLRDVATVEALRKDPATWRRIVRQIKDRTMPPPGSAQPTPAERDRLILWLGEATNQAEAKNAPRDPGRVLLHRLSRLEYNNTVRDLFGVAVHPADKFPADGGGGGGFDNNADTLYIPPVLLERYLDAADEVLSAAKPARLFFVRPSKTLPPRAAAQRILAYHARRTFRRPVEPAETARLLALYDRAVAQKQSHEAALRLALKTLLVSPRFLFRVEQDAAVTEGKTGPAPLSDFELASRLSYFLWASMPDETLFALAAQKRLRDPKVLSGQVTRMLMDPKAEAFADSFAGQWLRVRELYTTAQPDPRRFPEYSPALRDAMYQEPVQFFLNLLRDNASVLEMIDCRYAYLNETLARHYGIDGVVGPQMRRVALTDENRGGLLTMAGILTVTSYPQRTSPVLRGKWVLSELLGTPPPPPPPVVPTLSTNDAPENGLTFRQRLEKHRERPECATCHNRLDPLGFGLENFDVIGRWREQVGGAPVDATGKLGDAPPFRGPRELKQLLLTARRDEFVRNLTEKMLAYALGRGLEPHDLPSVRQAVTATQRNGFRAQTLVREIVASFPFQYRSGDPPAKTGG